MYFKTKKFNLRSFGCVFYEINEFRKAFNGENEASVTNEIINGSIPDLGNKNLDSFLKKYYLEKITIRF